MKYKIALAGNPNTGKTTLFNLLTGSNQFVGNWPGVTVEKKEGKLKGYDDVIVVDLPGVYSLSPYTLEEVVARKFLVDERPDAILNIIDGTNIERNLYLTTQLMELGIPIVLAVNMMDIVRKNGDKIDITELSKRIGHPVLEISALKETGIDETIEKVVEVAKNAEKQKVKHIFSGDLEHALAHIEEACLHEMPDEMQRWYSIKIFERDHKVREELKINKEILEHIEQDIKTVEQIDDDDAESIITNERYIYVGKALEGCYVKKSLERLSTSAKIDKIVTNRILALPIFAIIMFMVYYLSISTIGGGLTDWINEGLFGQGWEVFGVKIPSLPDAMTSWLDSINCATWLQGLIVDGILAGVGAVIGFLPQMLVLFFLLAFLEACGYMSRIAFVLDKIFRKFGLSGKSFIPILVGTGCGVPGIMASRTIENLSDRRMTIITTTFIPCSAKLPVIALIAGAIYGGAWWVAPSAYFLGISAIVISGIILKKTKLFEGDVAPFVMELPTYHMPTVRNLLRSMWERGWSFIKKAGTIVLLASVLIWFLSNFGWNAEGFGMVDMDESILSYIGSAICIIFAPLGWGNWESAVATLSGLLAKENIVGTFGVLYGGVSTNVWENLQGVFDGIAAYSFLAFNLLCAPCFAAVGAIKSEMNSIKWTIIAVSYQCIFAYAVSLMIYQFGNLLNGRGNIPGVVFAVVTLAFMGYMLARHKKDKDFL